MWNFLRYFTGRPNPEPQSATNNIVMPVVNTLQHAVKIESNESKVKNDDL